MRNFVVVDAPSNLGLRPPASGTVPGCHKLAGALREQGILRRLGAAEGGVVVPPRYDRGDWREGDGVFNAAALAAYTRRLADRIERHVRAGGFPVVLGGDCSIQLGASLALRRLGRYGLAADGGTSHALKAVGEPRPTSGTPATPTASAPRAARRRRSPPAAASATSPTWRVSARTSATRTSASPVSATPTRRIPRSSNSAP